MSEPTPTPPPPAAVTWRSLLIGLLGVAFVCGLAPYNDFVAENTLLIGNFLPIGLLLIVLVLLLGVNLPLRRVRPRWALRQAELSVVVLMVLVSCAIPSSGLMRYLPGSLIGIYSGAADRPTDYGPTVDAANIPDWLLPKVDGASAAEKGYQHVFTDFRARAPDGVVPWSAWLRPVLTWGVLVVLLWGLLIGLSLIVRKQWTENERLSFPLATVYQSLIESPAPGHSLNALFRARGFWIAAGCVFVIHGFNALHAYDPNVPAIPLTYDLTTLLTEPPWSYTNIGLRTNTVSFSMIGIAFFVQTKITFSLWSFYALWQAAEMLLGTVQIPFTDAMKQDQTFGGLAVFAGVIVFIGRRHWWLVIRHMFGRRRPNDGDSRYLPYVVTGWMTFVCFAGVVAWLALAGMSVLVAALVTALLVLLFMAVARVMAETGLIFVQIDWWPLRALEYPILVPSKPMYALTATNFFFGGWLSDLFHDLRESLAAFFQLGVRVTDESFDARPRRGPGYAMIGAVALALGVGYLVSWASTLKVEYTYAVTSSASAITPNSYGTEKAVRALVLDPSMAYQAHNIPREASDWLHNPLTNIGVGAAIVGLCSALRILLSWWPLHPAAFVVLYSYATQKDWFSIFLGWLAKVIVVRLGGASLLKRGRAVFIGLIVGEAFAAAFWLVTNLILNACGREYKALLFLPG